MTTWIRSEEAARVLGVSKPTLYAYVSRGMVERHTAPDGRTSLYARRDIDALAGRARTKAPVERPTIDALITSAVTALHDDVLLYRGRAADELARTATYEQVAELLWTGSLPASPPAWPVDRTALDRVTAVVNAARPRDPLVRLTLAAATLADGAITDDHAPGTPPEAARLLLALAPSVLGGPRTGDLAMRLARAWVRRPSGELVAAIGRALVLLADHELATSTLAVRVATSVRTDAYSALAVGLHTVRGTLHGGAAPHAFALFADASVRGSTAAVAEPLDRRRRLSGFGHSIYRRGDPRVEPLLEAVQAYAAAADASARRRLALTGEVRAEAMRVLGLHANVDFALATLYYVAGLPADAPLFAVARIAGWAAHAAEESTERPVRYRGLARPPA
jgi:citrate synthase